MTNNKTPIDFVITWVDGSDPVWLKEKNNYLKQEKPEDVITSIDVSVSRYRDWETLQYWFRGVEKYAPWVNKIHFVTWGHLPAWLNIEHPKLHIVRHEDYIPEKYLPTFSSHPIELNFHRIPGLAEHFVYFNDDVFLTAPVVPEDFFVNGLPCDSVSESPIPCDNQGIWSHILVNNVAFLNRHFSKKEVKKQHYKKWYSLKSTKDMIKNMILSTVKRDSFFGLSTHHIHQAYLKSSFEQIWNMEPELLDRTCKNRFRSQEDICHFIIREYQLLKGNFHVKNMYKMGHAFHDNTSFQTAADALRHQQYKVICLNDTDQVHFEEAKKLILHAFQTILPETSSFEQF